MQLAILFWVYKDIDTCLNRAEWLRRENPDTPIYCLYGGMMEDAERFESALSGLTDDFYAFTEAWDPARKWVHGDQMLSHWYRDRGASLDWDTIFVAQWDMVLLTSVRTICGALKKGELLLPGLRPIAEVEHFWNWIKPGPDRQAFDQFRNDVEARHNFPEDPLCCEFIAAAFPREFLARYADEPYEAGFLEYKIPILAQSWGFGFCTDHQMNPKWMREPGVSRWERFGATLHSEKFPVRSIVLALNRALPWGARAFHPYTQPIPLPGG